MIFSVISEGRTVWGSQSGIDKIRVKVLSSSDIETLLSKAEIYKKNLLTRDYSALS